MTEPRDTLAIHAEAQPEKVALIEDRPGRQLRWSFRELNSNVNRLCHALLGLGVRSGDKVIWCGQNSPELVMMMHAGRKLGVTAVPLNYRLTSDEAAYVVDNSDAAFVHTDSEYADLFETIRSRTPKIREVVSFGGSANGGAHSLDALLDEASPEEPGSPQADQAGATMIYTSGTTGKPKGALRRGLGDPDQIRAMLGVIGYVPEDVYLTTGPLYHSGPGGFMSIAHSLGNTVVLQRKFDAEDWLRLVDRHSVTTTFAAPTPLRLVCNLDPGVKAQYDRTSMKRMVANAAPWSMALKDAYLSDFPEDSLFEVYGSTELGVNTILRPEDQRRKRGSCGLASPGVELALFAEDGSRIEKPNIPGELFARSRSVFDAYHKAQDKYEADRRGDFHTVGDMAYFDEDGYYYICDRKKDMVISGGMNIYPAEIEAALEQHPDILDVAVFGIPSEEWGESVHAVVVRRPSASLREDDIVAFAREHLAGYKIPRSVSFVDEIPRTGSGKILKRVLREPYWGGRDRGVA